MFLKEGGGMGEGRRGVCGFTGNGGLGVEMDWRGYGWCVGFGEGVKDGAAAGIEMLGSSFERMERLGTRGWDWVYHHPDE